MLGLTVVVAVALAQEDTREVVDNGDGTWSVRADDVPTTDAGGGTWRYLGQVRAPYERAPRPPMPVTAGGTRPLPLAEELLSLRMTDASGAVWELQDVNEEAIDPDLARAAQENSDAWQAVDEPMRIDGTFYPDSWFKKNCDSDPEDDIRLWNEDESRFKETSPYTARQEGAVYVNANGLNCSGALLLQRWVLSAAHCVMDEDGEFDVHSWEVTVRDVYGNERNGLQMFVPSAYTHEHDYGDDWLLIKLQAAFSGLQDMDLYDGADQDFIAIDDNVHMLGYPVYTWQYVGLAPPFNNAIHECERNELGPVGQEEELYHQIDAEVSSVTPSLKRVLMESDGGGGQSGAPYFFCPTGADDVCAFGDKAKIISTHAGHWSNLWNYHNVGPRAATIRPQVQFIIQNN